MRHLIITLHGIRTFGGWQERLEQLLGGGDTSHALTVVNYKIGYFSILAFLIPVFRWLTVRRFRRFLFHINATERWDRIDLVAHSFGTHIVAWALYGIAAEKRPDVHTVVFAGSVLKSNFPWETIIGHGVRRVINDCGIKDDVLLVNQIAVLFTGMAGRLGFNGGMGRTLRNRYFDFGHSDYFLTDKRPDDTFMRRYWAPLLTTDVDPELVDMRKTSALTGIKLTILNNAEPIKLAVYVSPIAAAAFTFFNLYITAERTRNEALLSQSKFLAQLSLEELSRGDLNRPGLIGGSNS